MTHHAQSEQDGATIVRFECNVKTFVQVRLGMFDTSVKYSGPFDCVQAVFKINI